MSRDAGPVPIPRDVTSGVAIAVCALVSVVLMSHHPTAHGGDLAETLQRAVRITAVNRFVHGGMIAVAAGLAFGFLGFADRLGLGRPLVRLGLVAYALGVLVNVGAAALNGFVFSALAERYVDADPAQLDALRVVLNFSFAFNQALAGIGVVAWSAALVAWSLVLVRRAGAWKWIGVLGIAVGSAGAGFFLTGHLRLDVHGFGLFVLGQALWSVSVGAGLAFTKAAPPERAAG